MDKKAILRKLKTLLRQAKAGFKSQDDAISWSNKTAPLLKWVSSQYYFNFIAYSHKLNLQLSSFTLVPALNIMKSQIEMAIEELKLGVELEEGLPEEMYFSPNSHLDIQKNLARVLRQAKTSLWIYDPYMDEKIVEEISNIQAPEIKLITAQPKGLFKQRLAAAKDQFPEREIEAKVYDVCHDRYYIIDQDQVWTLGASLNKAGKKATLLSKLKDEKQKIMSDFTDWWASATEIKIKN